MCVYYMCVNVCMHMHVCVCVCVCVCDCVCVCMCMCVYVICVYTICVHVCMCDYVHVYMCICVCVVCMCSCVSQACMWQPDDYLVALVPSLHPHMGPSQVAGFPDKSFLPTEPPWWPWISSSLKGTNKLSELISSPFQNKSTSATLSG